MLSLGQLEILFVGSLVNSKPMHAADALQKVEYGGRFSDAMTARAVRMISDGVMKMSRNTSILSPTLLNALVTRNGLENSNLIARASAEVAEKPLFQMNPVMAAEAFMDEWRRWKMCELMLTKGKEAQETEDVLRHIDSTIDALAELRMSYTPSLTKEDVLSKVFRELEAVKSGQMSQGVPLGIYPTKSGSSRLGTSFRLRPDRVYTVGALKKTGKSKFLVFCLARAAEMGVPCTYLSLEMSREQVLRWYLGLRACVDTKKIPSVDLTDDEIRKIFDAGKVWINDPIDICFQPGASIEHVRHLARKLRLQHPKAEHLLFGIDFFQAMDMQVKRDENQAASIERLMYDLLRVAQEYSLAIILLSQLPNRSEHQERRTIADLKGGSAIAEASEAVLILDNLVRLGVQERNNGNVPFKLYIDQRDGESGLMFKLDAQLQYGLFFETEVY